MDLVISRCRCRWRRHNNLPIQFIPVERYLNKHHMEVPSDIAQASELPENSFCHISIAFIGNLIMHLNKFLDYLN